MENQVLIAWRGKEEAAPPKEASWYWTVGIISVGVAVAAAILQNYLLGLISLLAGFTVMVVGSRGPHRHTYKLTERGFMIGTELIPYASIRRFAIVEREPRKLTIETNTIIGSLTAPLGETDYRFIRTELLNRNIDEVEELDAFVERIARGIGL
jgi:hypothetical protein